MSRIVECLCREGGGLCCCSHGDRQHKALDFRIAFEIPKDFFENQTAIHPERSRLQLNYQSQIQVYVHRSGSSQLVSYEVFTSLSDNF